jgi:hypothetical protein
MQDQLTLRTSAMNVAIADVRPTDRERFERRIGPPDEKGCREFIGSRTAAGYGRFRLAGVTVIASRLSFYLATGVHPMDLLVCHHCDNPPCVNPDHLFLGTKDDNMADMVAKGRAARTGAKLTEEAVVVIRAAYAAGTSQLRLAATYGVTPQTIAQAIHRKRWKSVA